MSEENLPAQAENLPVQKKGREAPKRFIEKGPHVVFDSKTKIFWMKKDSWQDKGKYFNWHESRDYSDNKNMRKIGGFDDWELPSNQDAASLYDENFENKGKGDILIHVDPVFPEGSFKLHWLKGDTSTRRPRFDYSQGKESSAEEYSFGAVRLCRKDSVVRDHTRPPRRR
jgi:hypothetical protein